MNITTEVLPSLYLFQPGKSYRGYMKSNAFLLDGRFLIDSGPGGVRSQGRLLKALETLEVERLDYLLLTHGHPDHIGAAKLIREKFGARIAIAREECARFGRDLDPDICLAPGQELENGKVRCIHTPGHSPGHYCFYFPERSILFSGDMVPGWGTTVISPPDGDMQSYVTSLRNMALLSLSLLCPGHGPPMHEPKIKIEEVIRHRLEREKQVHACLGESHHTIKDILGKIYPELGSKLRPLARKQIVAHLLKLQKEGRARKTARGWKSF